MRVLCLLTLCSALFAADAVRLDFGSLSSLVQPGWTAWTEGGDGFGPVSHAVPPNDLLPAGCTIELGPAKALGCRWAKPDRDARTALVSDSFFARAETPPVITLSGLPKGEFRVVLWFNDARGYEWPQVTVLADDALGKERVAAQDVPQGSSGDSSKAGRADFLIQADGTNPVRLATGIPIEPGSKKYVFLCGLEILAAATYRQASLPVPENGAADLACQPVRFSWDPVPNATGQTLLLGTTADSLEPVATDPTRNAWLLAEPAFGTHYYWRVDATVDGKVVPGNRWEFTIETGQPTHPLPVPGAENVSSRPSLHWRLPQGAQTVDLWLGPAPDQLAKLGDRLTATRWEPKDLARNTPYFWRVDSWHGETLVPGPVWQFRTAAGGARLPMPVDGEREVSADTVLRWTPGGSDAVTTLWIGDTPETLQRYTGKVESLPLRLGQTVFWRVDEQYGEETLTGTVWQFTVGNRLVIDDFENYTATLRVTDTWRDGRAEPANTARVWARTG